MIELLIISKNDILKTSLGYQLRMFSEGEELNLYLKSNGEFRFYLFFMLEHAMDVEKVQVMEFP